MKLTGRNAIVTGGARGIGEAITKELVKLGARVVIVDVRPGSAEETAVRFRAGGGEVYGMDLDVTKNEEIEKTFKAAAEKLGSIDILVNNAGIQIRQSSLEFTEENWDKLMDINLKAVFFCAQTAARLMKERKGGCIVNISSGTSVNTTPGRAPYVISKAGVNALTSVLAAEWASSGIRVNAVAPGWIETEMVKEGMRLGVISNNQILSVTPIGRMASPEEIATVVAFLACEEARYVAGQTIFVDGGWTSIGLPITEYIKKD